MKVTINCLNYIAGLVDITGGTITGITDLAVEDGGTEVSTLAAGGLLVGNAANAVQVVAPGATTTILVGGGAGTAPVWTTATGTGSPVRATSPTVNAEILKGPAAVTVFAGTVTAAASTTVTFSSAADAILAGYDATNPVLGVTLISNALTRYIVSWTNSTTCVVNLAVTWAGTAITSVQLPIATFVDSSGVAKGWMNAAGNVYFVANIGINITTFGTSAAKVLAMGSGTAPTTSPADAAQMWVQDTGAVAAKAGLHMRDEAGNNGPIAFANKVVYSHSATEAVTVEQMFGGEHLVTGAYVLSLPTAAVGYHGRFQATTAAVFSLDLTTGTDVIVLNGTALAAGNKATSDGTIYNEMEVVCRVAGTYIVRSLQGLAIDGGA